MSGIEIFGATLAALDAAIQIVRAVHQAVGDAKDLQPKLDAHRNELKATRVIIQTSSSEPDVRGNVKIMAVVKEVGVSVAAVTKHLETLGGRGRFAEVAHQLAKGKKEKAILEDLMCHLSRRKDDLTTLIGVLNVTLARKLGERLARPPEPEAKPFTSRIITNNTARSGGFMLNAPVTRGDSTVDQGRETDYLFIDNNTAESNGVMINYATTLEVLNDLANDFLVKIRSQNQ